MDDVQRLAVDLGHLLDELLVEAGPSYVRAGEHRALNAAQTQLLLVLGNAAEPLTLAAMADRTQRSVASTSRMVVRLEGKGLVSRDDRCTESPWRRVELTAAGRALLHALRTDRRQRLENYVGGMGKAQRLRLAGALHLLSRRLDRDLADPGLRELAPAT
jgi:DNA-binding MarR family transcriptional regulator